jgi:protein gp37
MAETSIEWTDVTWNPVSGCTRASAGCDNCYAVTMTNRLEAMGQEKYSGLTSVNQRGDRHFNGVVRVHEDALKIPLGWNKPRKVFVNSMSDLFHKDVPFEFIDKVFAVMALCPQHTFQVLTKRPDRMADYFGEGDREAAIGSALGDMLDGDWIWNEGKSYRKQIERLISLAYGFDPADEEGESLSAEEFLPLKNVWLGTSVENQQAADERIPHLLNVPAKVRFLSCEPLLDTVNLDRGYTVAGTSSVGCFPLMVKPTDADRRCWGLQGGIDWVIVGGESGPRARGCDIAWIRSIIEQCKSASVPVFVKQVGEQPYVMRMNPNAPAFDDQPYSIKLKNKKGGDITEWAEDLRIREFPEVTHA